MASNQTTSNLLQNSSGLYGLFPEHEKRENLVSEIYLTSITFIVFAGNILTLNVVCRKKRTRPPDVLLGCLATTDLLTALFVFPLLITYNIEKIWPGGLVLCYINTFISVACLKFSMFLAAWIAVERFLAIAKPFLYRSKVNMKKTVVFVASTLTYSIFVALLPVAGMATLRVDFSVTEWSLCVYHWPAMEANCFSSIYVILNMIDSALAVFVVLVSNLSVIVYFVRRKRRKRAIAPVVEAPPVMESLGKQERCIKQARSDLKYAHLMGIASLYFTLSFIPSQVLIVCQHYGWTEMAVRTVISFQLHVVSINLLFNPLLNGLIRKHYRGAYWFIVKHPLILCGRSTEQQFDFDAGKKDSCRRRHLSFRQVGAAAVVSARLRTLSSSKKRKEQDPHDTSGKAVQPDKRDPAETNHSAAERRRHMCSACSVGSDCDVCRQDSLSSAFLQVPESSQSRRDSGSSYFSTTEIESLPPTPGYLATPPVTFGSHLSTLDSDLMDQPMSLANSRGRPSLTSYVSIEYSPDEAVRFSQNVPDRRSFSSSTSVSVEQKDNNTTKTLPHYLPPILVTSAEGRSRSPKLRLQPLVKPVEETINDNKQFKTNNRFVPSAVDKPDCVIFEYVKPAEEVFDVVRSEKKFRKKKRKRKRKSK